MKKTAEAIPFYDLHSHFLPGMDDGAKTPEISLAMLSEMKKQGLKGIVATSHYYADRESINSFLKRRAESFLLLEEAAAKAGFELPPIALGSEAAYYSGLVYDDDLEKLCFGKSNFLLLEMPFSRWTPQVMHDVRQIAATRNIRLIIAHLERFIGIGSKDQINELIDSDALIQVNAENFYTKSDQKTIVKMIKAGSVQLLGSDSHNMEHRPPNMNLAIEKLQKANLTDELLEILSNNRAVVKAAL